MDISSQPDGSLRIGTLSVPAGDVQAFVLALARVLTQRGDARRAAPPRDDAEILEVTPDPQLLLSWGDHAMLVSLLDDAFGWRHFELSHASAVSVRDFIARRTVGVAGPDLDGTGGHGTGH